MTPVTPVSGWLSKHLELVLEPFPDHSVLSGICIKVIDTEIVSFVPPLVMGSQVDGGGPLLQAPDPMEDVSRPDQHGRPVVKDLAILFDTVRGDGKALHPTMNFGIDVHQSGTGEYHKIVVLIRMHVPGPHNAAHRARRDSVALVQYPVNGIDLRYLALGQNIEGNARRLAK